MAPLVDGGCGEAVVLKIQYPGVEETFRADLKCLGVLVRMAQPEAMPAFEEFAAQYYTELDYENERRNLEEIHAGLMPQYGAVVAVPTVHRALCSAHVLAMSFLEGQSLQEVAQAEMA